MALWPAPQGSHPPPPPAAHLLSGLQPAAKLPPLLPGPLLSLSLPQFQSEQWLRGRGLGKPPLPSPQQSQPQKQLLRCYS